MSPGKPERFTVQLRKQRWAVKATFVAHTGSSDPNVAENVKKAGFGYFVPKPANPEAFEPIVTALREI